jgi:hypothetical protein
MPQTSLGLDYLAELMLGVDEMQWLQAEYQLARRGGAYQAFGNQRGLLAARLLGGAITTEWKVSVNGGTGAITVQPTDGQARLAMLGDVGGIVPSFNEGDLPTVPNDGTWYTLVVEPTLDTVEQGKLQITGGSTTITGTGTMFTRLTGYTDGGYDRGTLIHIPSGINAGDYEVDEIVDDEELRVRVAPSTTEADVEWSVAGRFAVTTPADPRIHRTPRLTWSLVARTVSPADGVFAVADVKRTAGVAEVIDRRSGWMIEAAIGPARGSVATVVPRLRRDDQPRYWSFGGRALAGTVYDGNTYPTYNHEEHGIYPDLAGNTLALAIPVHLPDGARAFAWAIDSKTADNDSEVVATFYKDDGTNATVIGSTITRGSIHDSTVSQSITDYVDNNTYDYFIQVSLTNAPGAGNDARFYRVYVGFTEQAERAPMVVAQDPVVSGVSGRSAAAYTATGDHLVVYTDDGSGELRCITLPRQQVDINGTFLPAAVVISAAGGDHPAIVRFPAGAPYTHRVVYERSAVLYTRTTTNNGATWSGETTLWDPSGIDASDTVGDPCLVLSKEGRLYLVVAYYDDSAAGGAGLYQLRAIRSDDYGATWNMSGSTMGELVLELYDGVTYLSPTNPDVVQTQDGAYHLVYTVGTTVRYLWLPGNSNVGNDLIGHDGAASGSSYPDVRLDNGGTGSGNYDYNEPKLLVGDDGEVVVVADEYYNPLGIPGYVAIFAWSVAHDSTGTLACLHGVEVFQTDEDVGSFENGYPTLLPAPGGARMFTLGTQGEQDGVLLGTDLHVVRNHRGLRDIW